MRFGWLVQPLWSSALLGLVVLASNDGLSNPAQEVADHLFTGGRLYTLAGPPPADVQDEPVVEALAIRDGRIIAVGSDREMERYRGPETRVTDLEGHCIVPGLVDCHVHMQSLGRSLRQVDLVGTTSYEEVIARVLHQAKGLQPGEWIEGRGWDQNDWSDTSFPEHGSLSVVVPEHPVYLRRVDGHATLVNARALEMAGITNLTPDPAGGRIVRRADGSPSGVLVDAAMELVSRHIPKPTREERLRRLELALQHAVRSGLVAVHDAGIDHLDLEDYKLLLEQGRLPLRVYAMVDATPDREDDRLIEDMLKRGPQPFDASMRLAVQAVKLMADGALGSRGAALLEPYADASDHSGLPQYSSEEFYAFARPFHAAGFQLATHAIGDAANRMVLDVYERLLSEFPRAAARHRVEHAQVLAAADVSRFATLRVLPSMQPTHCTSDMPWAGRRLGPQRERGAYAWRSLLATGVVVPAGSDAPVESIDPLAGIHAAVTRQDAAGEPQGGWHAEQCMTRSEAVRAFTVWAAQAAFTEDALGTLEVGKLADLTVIDRDILKVPPRELLAARVLMTVVGGEVVHAASERR